ncbi:MAG: hypothetical protein LBD18_06000 [Treponema sp.]|jgi:hypothetical protein|nr:hypothetical protein [Treponema sp.]
MEHQQDYSLAAAAKQRLEDYLTERLGSLTGHQSSAEKDIDAWEFYTFLLEQAKTHQKTSEFIADLNLSRREDRAREGKNCKQDRPEGLLTAGGTNHG